MTTAATDSAAAAASAPAAEPPVRVHEPAPKAEVAAVPTALPKTTPTPKPAAAQQTAHAGAAAPHPDDGARASALLDGAAPASPAPSAAGGRFVVQVGAFADAATLHEARARVEKLGLKTYTQAVDTGAGRRTRVRVGPFATRAEAEAAAAHIKHSGLPASILTL